ncbi:MAG: LamB/YcsF family protein [Firmicutes bacterium]|nr:LamB/YcsF family protein [Bacillota bacterium]MCL5038254.1 LamB/YcsF family protein [Bacillota bacterium]
MGKTIDLNSDMGEAFGAYRLGQDRELMNYVTSANIACGFHAGDPRVMEETVALAREKGVGVGAHPGFPDLVGFGRREMRLSEAELRSDLIYQMAALDGFCRTVGMKLQHVKLHGALYNMAVSDENLAQAVVRAVRDYDRDLILVASPGSAMIKAGEKLGLPVANEVFADRAYNPDGTLVSRRVPGAVLHDPAEVAGRALEMVREGWVKAVDGSRLPLKADTICVHGDTPGAADLARQIRRLLEGNGVRVRRLRP